MSDDLVEERRRAAYRLEQLAGRLDRDGLAGMVAALDEEHHKELQSSADVARRLGIALGFAGSAGAVIDSLVVAMTLLVFGAIVILGDIALCWLVRRILRRWRPMALAAEGER